MGTNPSRSDLHMAPGTLVSGLALRGLAARSWRPGPLGSGSPCPAEARRRSSGSCRRQGRLVRSPSDLLAPGGVGVPVTLPTIRCSGRGANPALSVPRTVVSPPDLSGVASLGAYSVPWTTASPDESGCSAVAASGASRRLDEGAATPSSPPRVPARRPGRLVRDLAVGHRRTSPPEGCWSPSRLWGLVVTPRSRANPVRRSHAELPASPPLGGFAFSVPRRGRNRVRSLPK